MSRSPILDAIDQICEEKHISKDAVLETIEAALAVAYRKDFGEKNQNIKAKFNAETAQTRVFDVKEVVEDELYQEYLKQKEEQERLEAEAAAAAERGETPPTPAPEALAPETTESPKKEGKTEQQAEEGAEPEEEERRFDPKSMIALSEIQKTKPDANIGDVIETELYPPENYGRMAAQTAKQVIIQRLREAEREMTFKEFHDKVGEILTGTIQRIEGRVILVDLGHATAVMPPSEQIHRERYLPGQRVKVYVVAVNSTTRGPEILVSRSHPDMVKKLFSMEVPEVQSEVIEIKGIAREAGSRTKIAVFSTDPNIDPVGSCVGQRGTRVQTVIAELGGEKIDIIQYEEDPVRYLMNALSPAKVLSVQLVEEEKRAIAEVREDQLSLAIGRAGQNVRLAAKLTGWKIDIVKESSEEVVGGSEGAVKPKEEKAAESEKDSEKKEQAGAASESSPAKEEPNDKPAEATEQAEATPESAPTEEAAKEPSGETPKEAPVETASDEPADETPHITS